MTEVQQLRAELECEKYKVSQLKREKRELVEQLDKFRLDKESLELRIEQELEPRLKREAACYDAYVLYDKSMEACETFVDKVDELVEMVKENPEYYIFEDPGGDTAEKILWVIKQEMERDK